MSCSCSTVEHVTSGGGSLCYPQRTFRLCFFLTPVVTAEESVLYQLICPHSLVHPHSLKRTGGVKVGFGCGVRALFGSQRGIYRLPGLDDAPGFLVGPSVDVTSPDFVFSA